MSGTGLHRPALAARLGACFRAAATYDAFPHFSARVRRLLYNPLGILILAGLAALVCGVFLDRKGYVLLAGVLAVIALGIAWPCVSLRGVRGTLCFDRRRAVEGESVAVGLDLQNRLPTAAWGLAVRDGLAADGTGAADQPPAVAIASAPGRRTVRCRWPFVPTRRGSYPRRPARLITGFPFGLWESGRPLGVAATLLVWPRTFPVGPVPPVSAAQRVEGSVSRTKVGSDGEVLGVRPYRRGDSPRRIHWAQSARHDRLIVCELQANARPVVQVVLDSDPRVHASDGPDGSREWAVRVAASLARGWLEAGVPVGAAWHGQSFPAAAGTRQLTRLLDGLAELPDEAGPPLAEVLASPACRGFDGGLQVVVTTDAALAGAPASWVTEGRWWVVLQAAAFGVPAAERPRAAPPAVRPCLWLDAPDRIPALLREGWKEARHGS
jgi:uncharacterized protein (DUF58 family)